MPSTTDKSGNNVTYYSDDCVISTVNVGTSIVMLLPANPNRQGFSLYNVPAASLYLRFEESTNADTRRVPNDSNWEMLSPFVWRGAIYGRRNSGSGNVIITEFF